MSEKEFYGVSGSTKKGHSKLRGQPLQRHVSAWRRCVQIVHGEDLDRLIGGSSVHFVWATEFNNIGRSKAQQTTPYWLPYQCSHPIFFSLMSRKPAQDVAHIGRDVVIFGYSTNIIRHKTGCRAQNAIQAA